MASLIDIKVRDLTDSQLRKLVTSTIFEESMQPLLSELYAELQTRKIEVVDKEASVIFRKQGEDNDKVVKITKKGGVIKEYNRSDI